MPKSASEEHAAASAPVVEAELKPAEQVAPAATSLLRFFRPTPWFASEEGMRHCREVYNLLNPQRPLKMKETTTQPQPQAETTQGTHNSAETTQPQTRTEEEEEYELVWGGMDWNAPSED